MLPKRRTFGKRNDGGNQKNNSTGEPGELHLQKNTYFCHETTNI
jgi:hypothetical protein